MKHQWLFDFRGHSICLGIYMRNEWSWFWDKGPVGYFRCSAGCFTLSILM